MKLAFIIFDVRYFCGFFFLAVVLSTFRQTKMSMPKISIDPLSTEEEEQEGKGGARAFLYAVLVCLMHST